MEPQAPNRDFAKQSRVPPWAMWLIAAKRGRALTVQDIVDRSGLSRSTVIRTCKRKHWGFDWGVAIQFAYGCGYELGRTRLQTKRIQSFLDHGLEGLRHLQVRPGCPLWKQGSLEMRKRALCVLFKDVV